MQLPFKKDLPPDFSKLEVCKAFVQQAQNPNDLLRKELSVNLEEQVLLKERMRMMNGLVNDLPSSDPQYGMLMVQLKMDQIELDELKRREEMICTKIKEHKR